MRIVIDMQGAQTQSRFRGIGRYTMALTEGIIKNKGSHEVILVLNGMFPESIDDIKKIFTPLVGLGGIYIWNSVSPTAELVSSNYCRRIIGEVMREEFVSSLNPDFVLLTTLFEGFDDNFIFSASESRKYKLAIILYDLIPFLNPEKYLQSSISQEWYDNKLKYLKQADVLLAISNHTKSEALDNLKIDEDLVVNISSAVSDNFRPIDVDDLMEIEIRSKFNLRGKFIMYSGATDERKNHIGLLEAYSRLPIEIKSNYQLAFVGGLPEQHRNKFLEYAKKLLINEDDLIITGRVSDRELLILYNMCNLFVFPSWHEGFGLPALEAMKCGKAVIGSNTTSLPEVIGNVSALFDPYDFDDISGRIREFLSDEYKIKKLEEHSLEQSKLFSWDNCAERTIAAFEERKNSLFDAGDKIDFYLKFNNEKLINAISKVSDVDFIATASAISENEISQRGRQLFIDVSELAMNPNRATGIQRVVKNIVFELLARPPLGFRVEPVYARIVEDYVYARKFKSKLMGYELKDLEEEEINFKSGDIFIGLDFLHQSVMKRKFYENLFQSGADVYFVVYDLMPLDLPEYSDESISRGFENWLDEVTKYTGVICISNDVSVKVRKWLRLNKPLISQNFTIETFHLGANFLNNNCDDEFKLNKSKNQCGALEFLMVGTLEPRKGHSQVLEAFDLLWQRNIDVKLIIVGREGWKVDELIVKLNSHPEKSNRLFWLSDIDDSCLERIYSESDAVIVSSYGEGFGLPLVEAALHEKPIIARNLAIFNEVAGDCAYYFDANDAEQLFEAIQSWIELYKENKHPKSANMTWLTWKQSAQQLLKAVGL